MGCFFSKLAPASPASVPLLQAPNRQEQQLARGAQGAQLGQGGVQQAGQDAPAPVPVPAAPAAGSTSSARRRLDL